MILLKMKLIGLSVTERGVKFVINGILIRVFLHHLGMILIRLFATQIVDNVQLVRIQLLAQNAIPVTSSMELLVVIIYMMPLMDLTYLVPRKALMPTMLLTSVFGVHCTVPYAHPLIIVLNVNLDIKRLKILKMPQ